MKIEDFKAKLEKSRKYQEDLDRIMARLKKISHQKIGRISSGEAQQLLEHIKRLRLLEGYHQIESFALGEARKEYRKEGDQRKRLRAVAHALGIERGKPGRKPEPEAIWILLKFNRYREKFSYRDSLAMIAKEFKVEDDGGLKTVEKIIERAKKKYPEHALEP